MSFGVQGYEIFHTDAERCINSLIGPGQRFFQVKVVLNTEIGGTLPSLPGKALAGFQFLTDFTEVDFINVTRYLEGNL